jgi:uncharacterized protein YvpB
MSTEANINTGCQTAITLWRGAENGFANWQRAGTRCLENGQLGLDWTSAAEGIDPVGPGEYHGRNFYNGGNFAVGEAIGPEIRVSFKFKEVVASWNADTPDGTWVEVRARVCFDTRWSEWYNLGIWASGCSMVKRHSVSEQADEDASVVDDTLVIKNKQVIPDAYQLKLRLFSTNGRDTPLLRNAAVVVSGAASRADGRLPGNPALWGRTLDVPQCSQMVYPNGGNVWCSPTSIAMVLRYWGKGGACAEQVHNSVAGTYDWKFDGYGNWPFNTAYAATYDLEAYVMRFTSLAAVEPWIAAGVPVVVSFRWQKGALTGAPVDSSNGHLSVLVGFDGVGNPVINDPAAEADEDVRRTYLRTELESLWLGGSGGTVYLVYPPGWKVPEL